MTLTVYALNGTSGATATVNPGNTGGYALSGGGTSTQTLQSGAAYQGSTGLRCYTDGTNVSQIRFKFDSNATPTQAAISLRVKIPAAVPTGAANSFLQISDSGLNKILQVQYHTSGIVRTNDKGNNTNTIMTAAQATAGSWFRIEIVITNLSTTAGTFTARAYSTGSTQVGSTVSITTGNLGTAAMVSAGLGVAGGGPTAAYTQDIDSLQMNDGSSSEIGEYVPNTTPPTVVAGANQTVARSTATNLTCTATPAGGSAGIASYQWALVSALNSFGATITGVSITNATSQTASFTTNASNDGRYIFSVTATDLEGNTSAPVTTRVFVPGTAAGFLEVTSNSGWITTTPANVNDASDSTIIESGASGSNGTLVLRLAPLQVATSGFSLAIRDLVQVVGGSQQVALLEGATVRKDWGATSPGTAYADEPALTLTTGEMATVTSWNELDIRLKQV